MNLDEITLYSPELREIRRKLENLSHLALLRLTENVWDLLTPADRMTYDIERYANGWEDHQGRVRYVLVLLRDKRIKSSQIPLLNKEPIKAIYTVNLDLAYLLAMKKEKPLEECEPPVQTPASKIVYVTNPRWEHKKTDANNADAKDNNEGKKSEELASIGDTVLLMADIKNCPEGAEVVFDIYDMSVKPPKKIDSSKGKHNSGLGKGEWVVTCKSETGDVPQLAFEATARSRTSEKCTINLATTKLWGICRSKDLQPITLREFKILKDGELLHSGKTDSAGKMNVPFAYSNEYQLTLGE